MPKEWRYSIWRLESRSSVTTINFNFNLLYAIHTLYAIPSLWFLTFLISQFFYRSSKTTKHRRRNRICKNLDMMFLHRKFCKNKARKIEIIERSKNVQSRQKSRSRYIIPEIYLNYEASSLQVKWHNTGTDYSTRNFVDYIFPNLKRSSTRAPKNGSATKVNDT